MPREEYYQPHMLNVPVGRTVVGPTKPPASPQTGNVQAELLRMRAEREKFNQQKASEKVAEEKPTATKSERRDANYEKTQQRYLKLSKAALPAYAAAAPVLLRKHIEPVIGKEKGIGRFLYGKGYGSLDDRIAVNNVTTKLLGTNLGLKVGGSISNVADMGSTLLPNTASMLAAGPALSAGLGSAMQAKRLSRYRTNRDEMGKAGRTAEIAGTLGSLRSSMFLPAMLGSVAMGKSVVGPASAIGKMVGGGILKGVGAKGLASGAMAPLVGGLALALPSIIGGIAGMKAEANKKRLRGSRQPHSAMEKKYSLSFGLDNLINRVVASGSQLGMQQIMVELLKYIEAHTSPIPEIAAIVKSIEDARTKDARTSEKEYAKQHEKYNEIGEGTESFGSKIKRKVSGATDKAIYGARKFTTLINPFQQIMDFVLEGKTPHARLKELKEQYSTKADDKNAFWKKVSKETGISFGLLRLVNTPAARITTMSETPEGKNILLLSAIFDVLRLMTKETVTIRRKGFGVNDSFVSFVGPNEKKSLLDTLANSIPGVSSIYNILKGAYGIGKGIVQAPKKIHGAIVGGVQKVVGKVKGMFESPLDKYTKDPTLALKETGLHRTQKENIDLFMEKALPKKLDEVTTYEQQMIDILKDIYDVESMQLEAFTGTKHTARSPDDIKGRIYDSLTGEYIDESEYKKRIEERKKKVEDHIAEQIKGSGKGFKKVLTGGGLGLGGAAIGAGLVGLGPLGILLASLAGGVGGAGAKFAGLNAADRAEAVGGVQDTYEKGKVFAKKDIGQTAGDISSLLGRVSGHLPTIVQPHVSNIQSRLSAHAASTSSLVMPTSRTADERSSDVLKQINELEEKFIGTHTTLTYAELSNIIERSLVEGDVGVKAELDKYLEQQKEIQQKAKDKYVNKIQPFSPHFQSISKTVKEAAAEAKAEVGAKLPTSPDTLDVKASKTVTHARQVTPTATSSVSSNLKDIPKVMKDVRDSISILTKKMTNGFGHVVAKLSGLLTFIKKSHIPADIVEIKGRVINIDQYLQDKKIHEILETISNNTAALSRTLNVKDAVADDYLKQLIGCECKDCKPDRCNDKAVGDDTIGHGATGGMFNGPTVVGEKGFELVKPLPKGGFQVFPHDESVEMVRGKNIPGLANGGIVEPEEEPSKKKSIFSKAKGFIGGLLGRFDPAIAIVKPIIQSITSFMSKKLDKLNELAYEKLSEETVNTLKKIGKWAIIGAGAGSIIPIFGPIAGGMLGISTGLVIDTLSDIITGIKSDGLKRTVTEFFTKDVSSGIIKMFKGVGGKPATWAFLGATAGTILPLFGPLVGGFIGYGIGSLLNVVSDFVTGYKKSGITGAIKEFLFGDDISGAIPNLFGQAFKFGSIGATIGFAIGSLPGAIAGGFIGAGVGSIITAISDIFKPSKETSLSKKMQEFLIGDSKGGILSSFKSMTGMAAIGATIGTSILPGVGTIAGGITGAAIGSIIGFFGLDKIKDFGQMIKDKLWNIIPKSLRWIIPGSNDEIVTGVQIEDIEGIDKASVLTKAKESIVSSIGNIYSAILKKTTGEIEDEEVDIVDPRTVFSKAKDSITGSISKLYGFILDRTTQKVDDDKVEIVDNKSVFSKAKDAITSSISKLYGIILKKTTDSVGEQVSDINMVEIYKSQANDLKRQLDEVAEAKKIESSKPATTPTPPIKYERSSEDDKQKRQKTANLPSKEELADIITGRSIPSHDTLKESEVAEVKQSGLVELHKGEKIIRGAVDAAKTAVGKATDLYHGVKSKIQRPKDEESTDQKSPGFFSKIGGFLSRFNPITSIIKPIINSITSFMSKSLDKVQKLAYENISEETMSILKKFGKWALAGATAGAIIPIFGPIAGGMLGISTGLMVDTVSSIVHSIKEDGLKTAMLNFFTKDASDSILDVFKRGIGKPATLGFIGASLGMAIPFFGPLTGGLLGYGIGSLINVVSDFVTGYKKAGIKGAFKQFLFGDELKRNTVNLFGQSLKFASIGATIGFGIGSLPGAIGGMFIGAGVGSILTAIQDIFGDKEKPLVDKLKELFLGDKEGGILSSFKAMTGMAVTGAMIGTTIFPVVGTIAGGIIGAAIGSIIGFFGLDKIKDYGRMIKDKLLGMIPESLRWILPGSKETPKPIQEEKPRTISTRQRSIEPLSPVVDYKSELEKYKSEADELQRQIEKQKLLKAEQPKKQEVTTIPSPPVVEDQVKAEQPKKQRPSNLPSREELVAMFEGRKDVVPSHDTLKETEVAEVKQSGLVELHKGEKIIRGTIDAAKTAIENIGSKMKPIKMAVKDKTQPIYESVIEFFKELIDKLPHEIPVGIHNNILDSVSRTYNEVFKLTSSKFESSKTYISDLTKKFYGNISEVYDTVNRKLIEKDINIKDISENVSKRVTELYTTITKVASDKFSKVRELIDKKETTTSSPEKTESDKPKASIISRVKDWFKSKFTKQESKDSPNPEPESVKIPKPEAKGIPKPEHKDDPKLEDTRPKTILSGIRDKLKNVVEKAEIKREEKKKISLAGLGPGDALTVARTGREGIDATLHEGETVSGPGAKEKSKKPKSDTISSGIGKIIDLLSQIVDNTGKMVTEIDSVTETITEAISKKKIPKGFGIDVKVITSSIGNSLSKLFDTVGVQISKSKEITLQLSKKISESYTELSPKIVKYISKSKDTLVKVTKSISSGISEVYSIVSDKAKEYSTKSKDFIIRISKSIYSGLEKIYTDVAGRIPGFITSSREFVSKTVKSITTGISNVYKSVSDRISKINIRAIMSDTKEIKDYLFRGLKVFYHNVHDSISGKYSQVRKFISETADKFSDSFKSFWKEYSPSALLGRMKEGISERIKSMKEKLLSPFKKLKEKITNPFKKLKEKAKSILGGGIGFGGNKAIVSVLKDIKEELVSIKDLLSKRKKKEKLAEIPDAIDAPMQPEEEVPSFKGLPKETAVKVIKAPKEGIHVKLHDGEMVTGAGSKSSEPEKASKATTGSSQAATKSEEKPKQKEENDRSIGKELSEVEEKKEKKEKSTFMDNMKGGLNKIVSLLGGKANDKDKKQEEEKSGFWDFLKKGIFGLFSGAKTLLFGILAGIGTFIFKHIKEIFSWAAGKLWGVIKSGASSTWGFVKSGFGKVASGVLDLFKSGFGKIIGFLGDKLGFIFKLLGGSKLGKVIGGVAAGGAALLGAKKAFGKDPTKELADTSKKATEEIAETTTEKVEKKVAKEAGEKAAEKGTEKVAQKVGEKVAEEGAEKATEKVAKETAEKVAEKTTGEVAEKATKKVGEETIEAAGKKAATEVSEKVGEKVAGEVAEKVAEKGAEKAAAKTVGKSVGKSLAKKLPFIGLVAGGLFAIQRALEGDYVGAAGELASGAVSTIPGVGTAASLAIDAALIGRDVMKEGEEDETKSEGEQTAGVPSGPPSLGGGDDGMGLEMPLADDGGMTTGPTTIQSGVANEAFVPLDNRSAVDKINNAIAKPVAADIGKKLTKTGGNKQIGDSETVQVLKEIRDRLIGDVERKEVVYVLNDIYSEVLKIETMFETKMQREDDENFKKQMKEAAGGESGSAAGVGGTGAAGGSSGGFGGMLKNMFGSSPAKGIGEITGTSGMEGQMKESLKGSVGVGGATSGGTGGDTPNFGGDVWGKIKQQIIHHEGVVLHPYLDSLKKPTIGIGHLILPGEKFPDKISKEEAYSLFEKDWGKHADQARQLPGFDKMDPVRQGALTDMVYNMGLGGVMKFKNSLGLMQQGKYAEAANEFLKSAWARQVGKRSITVTNLIRSGDENQINTSPPRVIADEGGMTTGVSPVTVTSNIPEAFVPLTDTKATKQVGDAIGAPVIDEVKKLASTLMGAVKKMFGFGSSDVNSSDATSSTPVGTPAPPPNSTGSEVSYPASENSSTPTAGVSSQSGATPPSSDSSYPAPGGSPPDSTAGVSSQSGMPDESSKDEEITTLPPSDEGTPGLSEPIQDLPTNQDPAAIASETSTDNAVGVSSGPPTELAVGGPEEEPNPPPAALPSPPIESPTTDTGSTSSPETPATLPSPPAASEVSPPKSPSSPPATSPSGGEPKSSGGGPGGLPVQGRISSKFGPRNTGIAGASTNHKGVDIAVPDGTPVKATTSGTISQARSMSGYGNVVFLDSPGGLQTRYAHNSAFDVKPGDTVKSGQVIAKSGHSGVGSGPHVHYETRMNGTPVDPLKGSSIPVADPAGQDPSSADKKDGMDAAKSAVGSKPGGTNAGGSSAGSMGSLGGGSQSGSSGAAGVSGGGGCRPPSGGSGPRGIPQSAFPNSGGTEHVPGGMGDHSTGVPGPSSPSSFMSGGLVSMSSTGPGKLTENAMNYANSITTGFGMPSEGLGKLNEGIMQDAQKVTTVKGFDETSTGQRQTAEEMKVQPPQMVSQPVIPNANTNPTSSRVEQTRPIDTASEALVEKLFANTITSLQHSMKLYAMDQAPFSAFKGS